VVLFGDLAAYEDTLAPVFCLGDGIDASDMIPAVAEPAGDGDGVEDAAWPTNLYCRQERQSPRRHRRYT